MSKRVALVALVGGGAALAFGTLGALSPTALGWPARSAAPALTLGLGLVAVIWGVVELRWPAAASPAPSDPRSSLPIASSPPAEHAPGPGGAEAEPRPAVAPSEGAVPAVARPASSLEVAPVSIPGALVRSGWDEATDLRAPPSLPPAPFSTALPFSALEGQGVADPSADLENPLLAAEVDRLHREVEAHAHRDVDRPPSKVPAVEREVGWLRGHLTDLGQGEHPELSLSRSGAVAKGVPEPPVPRETLRSLRRECASCGVALTGGPLEPICEGCGRPLCADCYWRPPEGPARHVCVACAARPAPR